MSNTKSNNVKKLIEDSPKAIYEQRVFQIRHHHEDSQNAQGDITKDLQLDHGSKIRSR